MNTRSAVPTSPLPVLAAIDELAEALDDVGAAVPVAPPGTGKTTGVPPALLQRPWARGRIILVVPRRMAARAAAARMSHDHGESVGQRFGYSVRHDRRVGPGTVVEAVTPGLLLRRIQNDPSLDGVCAVVLDEFHERSVDLDMLLALLTDVRSSLREDLRLLVMSATLEATRVAEVLSEPHGDDTAADPVPVIRVSAELYPIRTVHRPGSAHDRLDQRVADVVVEAVREDDGDILVFLPGAARSLQPRGDWPVDWGPASTFANCTGRCRRRRRTRSSGTAVALPAGWF